MRNQIWKFIKNLVEHPKTSTAGIVLILTGVTRIVAAPESALTGVPLVAILSGIGLLSGADSTKVINKE